MQHVIWPQLWLKPCKKWLENYSAVGWEMRTDVVHFYLGKGRLQCLQTMSSSGIRQSQGKVQSWPKRLQMVSFKWPHPLLLENSVFLTSEILTSFPLFCPGIQNCDFSKSWQFQKPQWAPAQMFLEPLADAPSPWEGFAFSKQSYLIVICILVYCFSFPSTQHMNRKILYLGG